VSTRQTLSKKFEKKNLEVGSRAVEFGDTGC
jgi:hypothetical protein